MSGHSKWHNIQAKKGKADAVEGAVTFSNHAGAEISSSAVRSAILHAFPTIPRWLLTLFTSF